MAMGLTIAGLHETAGTDNVRIDGELLALHCGNCGATKLWLYPWFSITIPWPDRRVRVSAEYRAEMEAQRLADIAADRD